MAPKKDFNQRAFSIVEHVTGSTGDSAELRKRIMQEMGRLGGLKGGVARAKGMTAKQRSDIAKKAAAARWAN